MVDDFMELPIQSVITKDKKLVCFSVGIGYKIVDAVKHYCEVTEFKEATAGVAMMHLAQRVREQTEEELTQDLKTLEGSLRGTLTTRLKSWGTEVFQVGFVDFSCNIRTYRLFGGLNAE
jgi:regulator of protease activity HflC (stomatin/prohibitin superfamily)